MKMTQTLIKNNDADFFSDQLEKVRDERIYEIPSDYAERVRYIPKGLSPKPGFFEFSFTPYLKEPFNLLAQDSGINEIAFMKPAQIGYNVGILENGILYFIGSDPRYVTFVTADKELAKEMVRERIDPAIDHAGLRHLIFSQAKKKGSRATGDTLLHKECPGGAINFVGAKNPDAFRGRTRQVLLLDEIDTYQDDAKEGSKIGIIRNRSNAFAESRKIIYGSTPLILQTSQIYKLYLIGDQRHYYVPCPRCGEYIVLKWHIQKNNGIKCGIIFEHEKNIPIYDSIRYKCQVCEKDFYDEDKAFFLLGGNGEWRPTAKAQVENFASYWINALYSPPGVYSWKKIVEDWARAWDFERNKVKDFEAYREFRNTKQGLPIEEKGRQIKYEKVIKNRRTGFILGEIPEKKMIEDTGSYAMLINAAVDIQKDKFFVDVKAYTAGGQTWTIDFFPIEGNIEIESKKMFDKLDDFIINKRYVSESKKVYPIISTFIDTKWGEHTDVAYEFCKQYSSGVYAIQGDSRMRKGLIYKEFSKETLEKRGLSTGFLINTTALKDRLQKYFDLIWETGKYQPEWYPNFPEDLRDDYFKMFEAEQRVEERDKRTNQFLRNIWKQTPGADNHAFDTFVYNLANLEFIAYRTCIEILGLRLLSWPDFWEFCKTGYFYNQT